MAHVSDVRLELVNIRDTDHGRGNGKIERVTNQRRRITLSISLVIVGPRSLVRGISGR